MHPYGHLPNDARSIRVTLGASMAQDNLYVPPTSLFPSNTLSLGNNPFSCSNPGCTCLMNCDPANPIQRTSLLFASYPSFLPAPQPLSYLSRPRDTRGFMRAGKASIPVSRNAMLLSSALARQSMDGRSSSVIQSAMGMTPMPAFVNPSGSLLDAKGAVISNESLESILVSQEFLDLFHAPRNQPSSTPTCASAKSSERQPALAPSARLHRKRGSLEDTERVSKKAKPDPLDPLLPTLDSTSLSFNTTCLEKQDQVPSPQILSPAQSTSCCESLPAEPLNHELDDFEGIPRFDEFLEETFGPLARLERKDSAIGHVDYAYPHQASLVDIKALMSQGLDPCIGHTELLNDSLPITDLFGGSSNLLDKHLF